MKNNLIIRKLQILMLLTPLIFLGLSEAEEIDVISNIHHNAFENVELIYTGFNEEFWVGNPENIESGSHYMERALKNELFGATPKDVEKFYSTITQPRVHELDYTFTTDGKNIHKTIHSNPGDKEPWELINEYIIRNDNTTFYIEHTPKKIWVHDSLDMKVFLKDQTMFNPIELVFPMRMISLDKISDVQLTSVGQNKLLKYKSDNNQNRIKQIECIINNDQDVLSSLIIYNTETAFSNIVYCTMNDYQVYQGVRLPNQMTIYSWKQVHLKDVLFQQNRPVDADYEWSITNLTSTELEQLQERCLSRMVYTLKKAQINTEIDSNKFWVTIPTGYSYEDKRNRYHSLRVKQVTDQLSDEEKLYASGIGPFEIKE